MKPIKKIDRYILAEVMTPFLGGLAFFLFVFLMFQLLRLSELFIVHGASLPILLKIVSLMTLSFLPAALPIAFLISILTAFGRLSSDSELVAMKACGMSLFRLAGPALAFSALIAGFTLYCNLEWVPWGQRSLKSTLLRLSNTKAVNAIKEGTFTTGFFDLLIFSEKVDTETSHLSHVFIYDEREPKNPMTIVAQSGDLLPVATGNRGGTSMLLNLHDGGIYRNDTAEQAYQKIAFREYKLFLKIDEGADTSVTTPEMYSATELRRRIREGDPKAFETRELSGEFWKRISMGIAPFLFVFLGAGFGTIRTRSVQAGAALVAFSALLIYYLLQLMMVIAVQRDLLPPALAMEVPNLVALVAGAWAFRRASW